MENVPLTSEDDNSDKKSLGKKKKNASVLGTFALEPKRDKPKRPEAAEDIWQKLTLTKRKGGVSTESVPLAEINSAGVRSAPEASETKAPLETLSPAEEQLVEREIVTTRQKTKTEQSVEHEESGDSEAASAIELFRDKIVTGGQDAEQAFAATLESLGMEADAMISQPAVPNPEVSNKSNFSSEPLMMAEQHEPALDTLTQEQPFHERSPAVAQEVHEIDEDVDPRLAAGGGGAGSPPSPPSLSRSFSSPGGDHHFAPSAATVPSKVEKEYVPYYNSGDVMSAALLGGLIGYLIGRRRGRIKTERKLRPIQRKLEKQVKQLQENITIKEYYIRKVAHQRAREQQQMHKLETADQNNAKRIEALEASQLHSKQLPPERIGRVLMTAEEKTTTGNNHIEKAPRPALISKHDKKVETMSRAELLDLSENVAVENTNLRRVYETHLVSEQGLRRLVGEYASGGDVQKALRQELMEHEIDFERDPMLRDRTKSSTESVQGQTLTSLLQKADILGSAQTKDELAVLKARQAHHENQRQDQQGRRRLMDVSMVAAITVLFVLVVMLLMRGR
jgi:hypothetical protein